MNFWNTILHLFGRKQYEGSALNNKDFYELETVNIKRLNNSCKLVYNSIFSRKNSNQKSMIYSYIDALDGYTDNRITNKGLRKLAQKDNDVEDISKRDVEQLYANLGISKKIPKEKFNKGATLKELFPNGAKNISLKQGATGNCYLLATIYAISAKSPEILKNSITKIDKDIYKVAFKGYSIEDYIVTKSDTKPLKKEKSPLGVKLIDVAYAKYRINNNVVVTSEDLHKPLLEVLNGGVEEMSLISGSYEETAFLTKKSIPFNKVQIFKITSVPPKISIIKKNKDLLTNINENNCYIVASTPHVSKIEEAQRIKNYFLNPSATILPSHSYAIKNITPKTVDIVNPYNTDRSVKITREKFNNEFDALYIVDKPQKINRKKNNKIS